MRRRVSGLLHEQCRISLHSRQTGKAVPEPMTWQAFIAGSHGRLARIATACHVAAKRRAALMAMQRINKQPKETSQMQRAYESGSADLDVTLAELGWEQSRHRLDSNREQLRDGRC
jgi:hypothetical protein